MAGWRGIFSLKHLAFPSRSGKRKRVEVQEVSNYQQEKKEILTRAAERQNLNATPSFFFALPYLAPPPPSNLHTYNIHT